MNIPANHDIQWKGPTIEPCGTPHAIVFYDDKNPVIRISDCDLRYELNKDKACPSIPYISNFHYKIWWSTVSNAFLSRHEQLG